MESFNIYNDPIISKRRRGTPDNPFRTIEESQQIVQGKAVLTEIPNRLNKVRVLDDKSQALYETTGEVSLTTFNVDYVEGVVTFHSDHSGKMFKFVYVGEGVHYFPANRVYLNAQNMLTVTEKFTQTDNAILEQKNRLDTQINSIPQPSEIMDTRVDKNGKVYPVAKDRIDAEQIKIEEAYRDANNKVHSSLKNRIDSEQKKIEEAYRDRNNVLHDSIKTRLDVEQKVVEDAFIDKNSINHGSLKKRIDSEQDKIEKAYVNSDRDQTLPSLDGRLVHDYEKQKKRTEDTYKQIRKETDYINVLDYGAVGDGVTDDTQAFIKAEQAAGSNKPILVPKGTYKATSGTINGKYYGERATLIIKERPVFGATVPPGEKSDTRTIKLSSIPQPILNEFYGRNSGTKAKTDAYTNTAAGEEALRDLETSRQNTAIGYQSQAHQTSQYSNTSIGSGSLQRGQLMDRTTALGNNACKWLGISNPMESKHELWINEKDEKNIWNNPENAHYVLLEMNPDVAKIIQPKGYTAPTGATIVNPGGGFPGATDRSQVEGNVGVGRNALLQLVKGSHNTAIGYQTMARAYTTDNCTALGAFALANNLAGSNNVAVGRNALTYNQTGYNNVAIGNNAAGYDVFGHRNVTIGFQAAQQAKGDNNTLNTIMGTFAAQNKTGGDSNVILGARAGLNNANGARNVIIGTEAAQNFSGNNSIIIGNKVEPNVQQDRILWIDYGNDEKAEPFIYGDMLNDVMNVRANLRPNKDKSQSLGTPSRRWDTLYAQNGTINTSDEREKQKIGDIPDEWLDAWENVEYVRYKFNDDVEKFGEEAIWHVGVIAQRIEEAFAEKGLNAFEIGLLSLDEWEDEYADVSDENDPSKTVKKLVNPAGNRYGVRFDECQFLEIALMRRELSKLKSK